MIKNTSKSLSAKQLLDIQVEQKYESNKVKVFQVSIKEGVFLVLDYRDRFGSTPDTEIYYARYLDAVSKNSKEYKEVNLIVTEYLQAHKKK